MKLGELKAIVDRAHEALGAEHDVILTTGHLSDRKNYIVPEDDCGVPLSDTCMFVDALDRYHIPLVEAPPHPREHEPLRLCKDCHGSGHLNSHVDPEANCPTCKGRGVV